MITPRRASLGALAFAAALVACGDNVTTDLAVECHTAADCPGVDSACLQRACTANLCGVVVPAPGSLAADPAPGDCHALQCDGMGHAVTVVDDTDAPSDGNPCTTETCVNGEVVHGVAAPGAACGSGLECDGGGTCVSCRLGAECPGSDSACSQRTCFFGRCGIDNAPVNTPLATQVTGDCQKLVCDGSGGVTSIADNKDLPNDNNACTTDLCTAGSASHGDVGSGVACGSGLECDGSGSCVGCLTGSDCPGSDSACAQRTCTAGACGVAFGSAGTLLAVQTPGDCHDAICDGSGHVSSQVDQSDPIVDGDPCTQDVCSVAGVPSNPSEPDGFACGSGGQVCDLGICKPAVGAFHPVGGNWTGPVCPDGVKFTIPDGGASVYACSPTLGLFKGTVATGADTWTAVTTGIDNPHGVGLAVHGFQAAAVSYLAQPVVGEGNFFVSQDSGATFTASSQADAGGALRFLYAMRFQPNVGNLLGTFDPATTGGSSAAVLAGNGGTLTDHAVSTATGITRAVIAGDLGNGSGDLIAAVFGETPTGAAATGGIFRSATKGVTWTEADTGLATGDAALVYSVTDDPVHPGTALLYAALQGGGQIYKSTDDGATWLQSNVGLPAGALVNVILVEPQDNTVVFAGTSVGLYKSTDAGATWVLDGFQDRPVVALAIHPSDATNFLVGVADSVGLYLSDAAALRRRR